MINHIIKTVTNTGFLDIGNYVQAKYFLSFSPSLWSQAAFKFMLSMLCLIVLSAGLGFSSKNNSISFAFSTVVKFSVVRLLRPVISIPLLYLSDKSL